MVLLPYFINNDFRDLDSRYITILPVGGSHSHRFEPLIRKLGINTLVITDLDPAIIIQSPDKNGNDRQVRKHAFPERSSGQISGNSSLEEWFKEEYTLDELLDLPCDKKELKDNTLRVAYQTPVDIKIKGKQYEALSATFEMSLVYSNYRQIIKLYKGNKDSKPQYKKFKEGNFIAKIASAFEKPSFGEIGNEVYEIVRNKYNDKVSFAIDLIYWLEKVEVPLYIEEGLEWLQKKLRRDSDEENAGGSDNG